MLRRIKSRGSTHVDSVDFDPPDPHQKHMCNLEPSISLMKSDGCDESVTQLNRRGTRGHIKTLRSRSDERESQKRGIMANKFCAIMAVQSLSPNRTARIFCAIFPIKNDVLPL